MRELHRTEKKEMQNFYFFCKTSNGNLINDAIKMRSDHE